MIRKLLHLDAPAAAVERMLNDFESWPRWMSGFESVETLEASGDTVRLRTVQRHLGQRMVQILDCTSAPGSVRQRQVKGRFRSWRALWRTFEAPSGDGTVLEVQVELDLGLLGLLVPKSQIHRALDQSFERTVSKAQQRARALAHEDTGSAAAPKAEEVVQALLREPFDPRRLVLEIDGMRYRLEEV